MKRAKKKTSSDYPQLAFRISHEKKAILMVLIDEVQGLWNGLLEKDQKPFQKNEIIGEALEKGLKLMKKSKEK